MTEIEFLAKLLLDVYASDELRKKIIDRIIEVEQTRITAPIVQPIIPTQPLQPYPYNPFAPPSQPWIITSGSTCQHEYPENWGSSTGLPSCKKCGQIMFPDTSKTLILGSTNLAFNQ